MRGPLCRLLAILDEYGGGLTAKELARLREVKAMGVDRRWVKGRLRAAGGMQPPLAVSDGRRRWTVTAEGRERCRVGQGAGLWGWFERITWFAAWLPVIERMVSVAEKALGAGASAERRSGGLGRLLLVGLAGAGLALALSEGLRKKVLDRLFGAEEEFEYTSTTSSPAPSSSEAELT